MRRRHGFLFSPAVPDGIKPVSGVRTRGFFCVIRTSEKKNEFAASVTVAHFPESSDFPFCSENNFYRRKNGNFFSYSIRCIVAKPKLLIFYKP
jgi:hypothetical protein